MNVAGLIPNGLREHAVHKPDDRRLCRHRLKIARRRFRPLLGRHRIAGSPISRLSALAVIGVILLDQVVDERGFARFDCHFAIQREGQIPDQIVVQRIGGKELQAVSGLTSRNDAIRPRQFRGHEAYDCIGETGGRFIHAIATQPARYRVSNARSVTSPSLIMTSRGFGVCPVLG